ncbi:MAG: IscS subfamily cysteine desulfurase [Gammaproteobacteria bacterium]
MSKPIYLDYAATTPADPRVVSRMCEFLGPDAQFGNPASRTHAYGWFAEEAVENARAQVAELLNCDPRELVWTSGATESDNLAIKGVAQYFARDSAGNRGHIVTSTIEHKAVVDSCKWLEKQGFEVSWLKPGSDGVIAPSQLAAALRDDTLLVSLMHVNNELGTVNDIAALGALCRERRVLFHVDAAQAPGKLAIDLAALPVDLMSFSAHKIYGPKGVGALYVRRDPRVQLAAQIHGGGHERGLRSGTLATHQLAGMGEAFAIAQAEMAADNARIAALRDRFLAGVQALGNVQLNGSATQRVPHILNLAFDGLDGEVLLNALKGIAVSTGSACNSATVEPSYVLTGIGLPRSRAESSLRFSFGRYTTGDDIDRALALLRDVVLRLRAQ